MTAAHIGPSFCALQYSLILSVLAGKCFTLTAMISSVFFTESNILLDVGRRGSGQSICCVKKFDGAIE